jgi:small-conductance mechanosensitive channel
VIALVLAKIVVGFAHRADPDRTRVFNLFGTIIKTVMIIIGLITALGTLGIDVTAMVAGLGLSGFALGFALKDAISNMLSGILILFYHPFRCGDRIKVSGCEGIVKDINLRYTVLAGEASEFLVPNSVCFTNWVAVARGAEQK